MALGIPTREWKKRICRNRTLGITIKYSILRCLTGMGNGKMGFTGELRSKDPSLNDHFLQLWLIPGHPICLKKDWRSSWCHCCAAEKAKHETPNLVLRHIAPMVVVISMLMLVPSHFCPFLYPFLYLQDIKPPDREQLKVPIEHWSDMDC